MKNTDYEYDYHYLASNADFIDDDFILEDDDENWDNYYHNITEELDEEY